MSAAVTSLIPSFLAFLAQYGSYDATPIIGTVFPNKSVQLPGFLEASNTDELIHDLAVLVSHRGIVQALHQTKTNVNSCTIPDARNVVILQPT